jgi:hypothetical protein
MPKSSLTITAVFVGLALSGCASLPWTAAPSSPAAPNTPAPIAQTADTAPAPTQPDAQTMQQVMAELQQLGPVDPAVQNQLMEDLRRSDPSLWPLVMQQFRATVAYRRRVTGDVPSARVERLPPVDHAAPSLVEEPPTANPVMPVSYTAPVANDGQQQLAEAIRTLEAEVSQNPTTPAELAQHARLRMLYAAAGRRDDAVRPIPATSPTEQQFLSKELGGLSAWLDAEHTPDAASRAAETQPMLAEALAKLAEAGPLVVRNLAFCTEVQSYGCMKRFANYDFRPNQEVLLYAEVENFISEPTANGYHTALVSSYQVLDGRGQPIAGQTFAATEDLCQNARRDFFIGYRLRLPSGINPGRYTLRLSIEDLKCRKVGQASIEFSIQAENAATGM